MSRTLLFGASALLIASGGLARTSAAEPIEDFYKGRTVIIVVGTEPGTGFDLYARVLSRHLGRHIPGNPNLVVQNMPGASGLLSANWLYNIAAKDGTAMATFQQNVPLEPVYGNANAKFDATRFAWIGNIERGVSLCGVSDKAGVASFAELQHKQVIFGATGATGPIFTSSQAVANLLGAKIKVISGYRGSTSLKEAMAKGEVVGFCALPWPVIRTYWQHELKSGEFKLILQLAGDKRPQFGGIPHIKEFIRSEDDRKLFGLIFDVLVLVRTYAVPPDVPPDRVAAMRKAFMATMHDPLFVADATKAGMDLSPSPGEEVARDWLAFASTPRPLIERAKQVMMLK